MIWSEFYVFIKLYIKEINFRGCKFCHIFCGFIFADGKISIASRGIIFAVVRYVMFMSIWIIVEERRETKLLKMC